MSKMKIGDLFELEKGALQSSKCTAGDFDFITASKDWKTHNEFSHDTEALIFAAMASGSLGRTHYVNGKFITSDLCYILTPKNNKKYPINLKFYHFVFNSLKDEIVKNTKSGTSKEAINQTNLKKYEIPYFDIEQQNLWIERLLNTKAIKEDLVLEMENQQELLKKIRQSILQEAIEGKLTATWREQNTDVESASILLERIKQEKEQLAKDKKITKQKPLLSISKDEMPFEIPDIWEWCKLGNLSTLVTKGSSPKWQGVNYVDRTKGILFITSENVGNNILITKKKKYVDKKFNKIEPRSILQKGDILTNIVGASIGRTAIYDIDEIANINQAVCLIRVENKNFNREFITYFLNSNVGIQYMLEKQFSPGRANLSLSNMSNILIPIPPKEEQQEIVKKIKNLFKICDELETQINSSKTNSQTLMRAVLKEAFEK